MAISVGSQGHQMGPCKLLNFPLAKLESCQSNVHMDKGSCLDVFHQAVTRHLVCKEKHHVFGTESFNMPVMIVCHEHTLWNNCH
jgi:hypothetical protein